MRKLRLEKMRKLFILLLFFVPCLAMGQQFTLSVHQEKLKSVFARIEAQSSFKFLYSEEAIASSDPVSFSVSNVSIDSVLKRCLDTQPYSYKLDGKNIIIRKIAGEKIKVVTTILKGMVIDENGVAVVGATVGESGSAASTSTNSSGEFVLTGSKLPVFLIISGAEITSKQISVVKATDILIRVETKVDVLDEALIIGYGKTSRRVSTGSSTRITQAEISQQPVSNPMHALAGRVSGLQIGQMSGAPGSQVFIQLRGRNSLANGTQPLIIVDGVPFPTTTLNNSLAGASMYTSPLDNINPSDIERIDVLKDADATAIYGSRGANGVILITTRKAGKSSTRLSMRSYIGAGRITRQMDLLTTPEYLKVRNEAFANDGVNATLSNAPDLLLWDTLRQTDWQKELIGSTAQQYDANVTLSGGNEFTQFLLGVGFHKETTVFPGDFNATKINGSFSVNHQTADRRFSLTLTGNFLRNENRLPREDISRRITLAPNAPKLFLPNGALNWENSTWINPLSVLSRSFTSHTRVVGSTLSLSYKVFNGLFIKVTGGYNWQHLTEHGITPQRSYNPANVSVSSATFGTTDVQTLIAEPQVSYSFTKGKNSVEAVVGLTIQQTDQQNVQQTGTGYSSDGLLHSIKAASAVTTGVDVDTRYRYTGQFARIAYTYARTYLVTVTARRDGSSRYGIAERFANFYSAGLGWVFTKEHWFPQGVFSFGKLRMSTGRSGNDQIGDYKYLDLYSPYVNPYQGITTFYPTQLFNPGYSWEQVNKREVGLEIGLLQDRFQLTTNYYHNVTNNQLVQYPLPVTTGFTGILMNLPATIRNTGFEVEVSGRIINQPKKVWTVAFNLTIPRNKLVAFDGLATSSYANSYIIGRSLNITKRFEFNGVDAATGLYTFKDYDGNNQLGSPQDVQKVIDASQRYFGGLQQTITIGRLTVSLFAQFIRQPNGANYLLSFGRPGALGNQPRYVLNRWQKPGDDTDIQRFSVSNSAANTAYGFYQFSDAGYSDASFIRLRNVYIEYDLLKKSTKMAGLTKCSLFMQGHNLFTWTSYKGLDPETQSFLPPLKLVTVGVQLNF